MSTEQTKPGSTENPTSKASNIKPEEKPLADNAAETIAGDNKFMAAILKILFSPITLLVGGALVLYWMNASKSEKQKYEQLIQEHENLKEDYAELKKKYKKLKAIVNPEKLLPANEQQKIPVQSSLTYRTSYLD